MSSPDYFSSTILGDIARRIGTPTYVYSRSRIEANFLRLASAFGSHHQQCYSVKANGNLSILRILRDLGAGFDVVSMGEVRRALAAGAQPHDIVFAGVGKRDDELSDALEAGIGWVNVESAQELRVLSDIAVAKTARQRVALRINPDVDPHTHRYMATGKGTSKFGIEIDEALRLVANREDYPGVEINGIHIHIGSTVAELEPYVDAMRVGLGIIAECRNLGARMTTFDMGGGFGVAYTPDGQDAPIEAIAREITPMAQVADVCLLFEPGRAIIADAGVLLTRVLYTKCNGGVNYAVVDAAMNDLIRPALYGARHLVTRIENEELSIEKRDFRNSSRDPGPSLDPDPEARIGPRDHGLEASPAERPQDVPHQREAGSGQLSIPYSIVGPICESGDKLAEDVRLPELNRGDLLIVHHAGAYGMSMASNYNTRTRAAEVLIDHPLAVGEGWGEGIPNWKVIRPREVLESLWAGEVECL